MTTVQETRVPFKIKLSEGCFCGEAIGKELKAFSVFEVRLNDGSNFFIEAVPDNELARYNWISYVQDTSIKLVPAIGKFIERYHAKNAA